MAAAATYQPIGEQPRRLSVGTLAKEERDRAYDAAIAAKHTGPSVLDNDGVCNMESFGLIIHRMSPLFWSALVIGGFCSPINGKVVRIIYASTWMIAFTCCFLTCFSNCFIQDPPFHVMWADIMVATVHLPGLYSVIAWTKILNDETKPAWRLLKRAHGTEEQLTFFCRLIAPFLFPAQIGVVCLVWAGYAWPIKLYLDTKEGQGDFSAEFHLNSMWVVIPPVVANVVANAAFFAFFCYANYLQFDVVLDQMGAIYEITADGWKPVDMKPGERKTLTGKSDEEEMSLIVNQVFAVQDELDDDCAEWSPLSVAFMTWALGAIVAVLFDFIAFLSGDDKINWTIWVVVIDAFLAISGILFVCGFLVMGAILTQRMDALIIESVECMRAKQVPISKAAAVYDYVGTGGRKTGLGFKIFNIRIDWSYVATFISLIVTVLGLVLTTVQQPKS